MPKINEILEVYLSLVESLVGGDKIVWPSSFLSCNHDGGRGCRSVVLRGDHHCDVKVVWVSRPNSSIGSSKDHVWELRWVASWLHRSTSLSWVTPRRHVAVEVIKHLDVYELARWNWGPIRSWCRWCRRQSGPRVGHHRNHRGRCWWGKFPSGSSRELYAHPLPSAPLSTKASQQSILGYTHGSSLSVDRCASYELDGDARHGHGFYPGSAAVWA